MAESYGFFNSAAGDTRQYNAADYAELFSKFFSSGVTNSGTGVGLEVIAGSGLTANIQTGYAILKGYHYKNDTVLSKSFDAADSVLHRIDRVVLRLDYTNRTILSAVKKGTAASSPVPPSLQRDSSIYEISLSQARINANATTVIITDERLDTDVCGLVSIVADVPDQEMWDKFNIDWDEIKATWEDWFNNTYSQVGSRTVVSETQPSSPALNDIWIDL